MLAKRKLKDLACLKSSSVAMQTRSIQEHYPKLLITPCWPWKRLSFSPLFNLGSFLPAHFPNKLPDASLTYVTALVPLLPLTASQSLFPVGFSLHILNVYHLPITCKAQFSIFLWSSPFQKFLLAYPLFALYSSYGILMLLLNDEVLESKDGILNILFLSLPSESEWLLQIT